MIQEALADPANIGFVKGVLGLTDLVVPGEDSRNKQLREIDLLLRGAPVSVAQVSTCVGLGLDGEGEDGVAHQMHGGGDGGAVAGEKPNAHRLKPVLLPSVPIDLLFDNHAVELEECRRWANSDAGQVARVENPAGFANVRAHAEEHLRAVGLAIANSNAGPAQTTGV